MGRGQHPLLVHEGAAAALQPGPAHARLEGKLAAPGVLAAVDALLAVALALALALALAAVWRAEMDAQSRSCPVEREFLCAFRQVSVCQSERQLK